MGLVEADHHYQGIKKDRDTLSAFSKPAGPARCPDYTYKTGCRRAATQGQKAGQAHGTGGFASSVLFVTTQPGTGTDKRSTPQALHRHRKNLLKDQSRKATFTRGR